MDIRKTVQIFDFMIILYHKYHGNVLRKGVQHLLAY